MKYLLMNKNQKIMLIEYNSYNVISQIYEIYNIEYDPLIVFTNFENKNSNLTKILNVWFRGRSIHSWRKDLEKLFDKLGVSSNDELLNKSYGLSLSDQYWLKKVNSDVKWERVAPIFDTGESMQCDKYTDEINFSSGKGRFFSNTDKDYEDILKTIGEDILRIDLSKLKGICGDYRLILEKYQDKLDMSDKGKEKLVSGLDKRITKLSEFMNNINK